MLFNKRSLLSEIRRLEQTVEDLHTWIDARNKELEAKARAAAVSVDFKRMNAFSIERLTDDNKVPMTIIGYYLQDKVGQWYLYCDEEHHARLVKEFNEYK
jgi:hypothetical protein